MAADVIEPVDLAGEQVEGDVGLVELELDAVRAREQHVLGRIGDVLQAHERAPGDEGDPGVGEADEAQHGFAGAVEGAGLLRLVDVRGERAVEVEGDEELVGGRELAQRIDEGLGNAPAEPLHAR